MCPKRSPIPSEKTQTGMWRVVLENSKPRLGVHVSRLADRWQHFTTLNAQPSTEKRTYETVEDIHIH